jgi:hypothetical protein
MEVTAYFCICLPLTLEKSCLLHTEKEAGWPLSLEVLLKKNVIKLLIVSDQT